MMRPMNRHNLKITHITTEDWWEIGHHIPVFLCELRHFYEAEYEEAIST